MQVYVRAEEDVPLACTDQRPRAIAEAFDAVQAGSPLAAVHRSVERVLAATDDLPGPDRLAIALAEHELREQVRRALALLEEGLRNLE